MLRKVKLLTVIATTFALGVGVASPASAQWRRGGYDHYRPGFGPGAVVGGALLGLGVGALLAAPYYAPPPRVYYAPPPPYPPPYAYSPYYAPGYAPPPPAYYPPY